MSHTRSVVSVFDPSGVQDALWKSAPVLTVKTYPTPAALQPSEYLRKAHTDGQSAWGAVTEVRLQTWQTRQHLSLLIDWPATSPVTRLQGPDHFLDRVAVLFPTDDQTPLALMGSPQSPAQIWSWRADGLVEKLTAQGPGTIQALASAGLKAQSHWNDGRWSVVLTGPQPSGPRQCGLAVWQGGTRERAGMKAFTPSWVLLDAPE
jgi:DMSO reductase family type II enzyme heme b subunit